MNKKQEIVEIMPDLERVCKHLTEGHELWEDLNQEILLVLLEKNDEQLDAIVDIKKYAIKLAYLMWLSKNTVTNKKGESLYNTSSFYFKYRYFDKLSQVDIEDLRWLAVPEEEVSAKETYNEILASNKLTPKDKAILKEYVRRDCKVSQFAKDADVNRHSLSKQIKRIIEKCKTI